MPLEKYICHLLVAESCEASSVMLVKLFCQPLEFHSVMGENLAGTPPAWSKSIFTFSCVMVQLPKLGKRSRGQVASFLRDEWAAFVCEQEVVDVFEIVYLRLQAGVEDHVLHYAAGQVVAGGVQQKVGLFAREP